jgi:hypothetical protein
MREHWKPCYKTGGGGGGAGSAGGSSKEYTQAIRALNQSFPKLTGSEKQVAWAESIRKKALNEFKRKSPKTWEQVKREGFKEDKRPLYNKALNIYTKVLEKMRSKTDAKFWIENRKQRPYGNVDKVGADRFFNE